MIKNDGTSEKPSGKKSLLLVREASASSLSIVSHASAEHCSKLPTLTSRGESMHCTHSPFVDYDGRAFWRSMRSPDVANCLIKSLDTG